MRLVHEENRLLARSMDECDEMTKKMIQIRMGTNNRMATMTSEDVACLIASIPQ